MSTGPDGGTSETTVRRSTGSRGRGARTALVGAAVVVLFLVAVGVFVQTSREAQPTAGLANAPADLGAPSLQNRPAPGNTFPLPLQTLEPFGAAEPVDVATLLEQPLVINFWATWCVPCVREMPELKRVSDQLAGRVTFLGVNVMDSPANAEPFIERLEIDYMLAADPDGAYWRATSSFGMPTTLLVRTDGTVVYRHTGELDAEQLLQLVSDHLDIAKEAA